MLKSIGDVRTWQDPKALMSWSQAAADTMMEEKISIWQIMVLALILMHCCGIISYQILQISFFLCQVMKQVENI